MSNLTSWSEAHVLLVVDSLFGVVELQDIYDGLWVLLLLQLGNVGGLQEAGPLLWDTLQKQTEVTCFCMQFLTIHIKLIYEIISPITYISLLRGRKDILQRFFDEAE